MSKALVLGGGGIRGSFQAGAIYNVVNKGFYPHVIYGTSIGSINAAFYSALVHRNFKANHSLEESHKRAAFSLCHLWSSNIRSFKDIGSRKSIARIGWDNVRHKFTSFLNVEKFDKLFYDNVDDDILKNSPVQIVVTCIDIENGEIVRKSNADLNILKFILASSRIPLMMPDEQIHGKYYIDGGCRDIVPLEPAIHSGADEIVVISCDPKTKRMPRLEHGDIFKKIPRVISILTNEIYINDLNELEQNPLVKNYEKVQQVNKDILNNKIDPNDKRIIKTILLSPSSDKIRYVSITDFDSTDIHCMIEHGMSLDFEYPMKNPT